MAEAIINTKTYVPSGTTYTIQSGSTFSVPNDLAFYVANTNTDINTLLNTANGATGILFDSCQGSGTAGTIFVSHAKVELSNSTFSNNTVKKNLENTNSGAIGIYEGSSATLTDCLFDKNHSEAFAGAIDVIKSNFTFTGVTFSHNTAELDAGALAIDGSTGSSGGTATSVTFDGNTATRQGGAIALTGAATLYATASTISNNYAGVSAGGVGVSIQSFAKMSAVTISGNSAGEMGGAIGNIGTTTIESMTLSNNYAGQKGGAVGNGGTFTATSVTFSANSAGNYGGAIYNAVIPYEQSLSFSGPVSIADSLFEDNTAQQGGAVYNSTVFAATNSTFSGNEATQAGGAIYNVGQATVTHGNFSTNTAVDMFDYSNGGAIFNSGSLEVIGSTFGGNTAGQAGAIWLATGGTMNISGSTFTGNEAVKLEVGMGTTNNSGKGGAICCGKNSTLIVSDSLFDGNSALSAGAISLEGTFTVIGSTFTGNKSVFESTEARGGAIKVENGYGVLCATNTLFTNNYSYNYGGAVSNNGGKNTVLDGCTFSGNTAPYGGALNNASSGIVTVKNSVFATETDTIYNVGKIYFSGTNTLNSVLFGSHTTTPISYSSGTESVTLQGAGTISQTYVAQGIETTFDGLTLDAQILGGKQNADVAKAELVFKNVSMTTNTKIYGAGTTKDSDITVDKVNLSFTGSGMGDKALVCAGGAANGASITATTVTVNASAKGDMGILYGGADLTNSGSFKATEVNTTINGGHWLSFVGNGSRGGNGIDEVTTDIAKTVLTIKGGTFDKMVYAGAFAAGDQVSAGSTELNISGGTFKYMVFGGNGGNSLANSGKSTVTGDTKVNVTVGGGEAIHFDYTLFSGSYGTGIVSGKTYMTFSGDNADGTMLSFAKDAYVSGGSQKAWHGPDRVQTYVFGGQETEPDVDARYLTFDGYTGKFGASMSNGFSNVEIKDSRVEFTGAVDGTEVDLRYVKAWNFSDTEEALDSCLTWTEGSNDFAGDTINLNFSGNAEWTFMTGSDATLKGWDKAVYSVNGVEVSLNRISRKELEGGLYELTIASA